MAQALQDHEDAYGHELIDYFERGEGFEIIEREDGFFDVSSGPETYFIQFDEWPEIEKTAMEFAKGKVLDIGTGAGRVCLHLQGNGLECLGIDNSPNAIKVAARRGVVNTSLVPFEEISALNVKFDTVTMYGNNFGLFGNRGKAAKMLDVLYQLTSSDATILAESLDPYHTNQREHLEYQAANRSQRKMSGQLKIRVRYKKYVTPWFEYLIVSREEMENMLENTGWYVSRFITDDNPLYIAVLKKRK